MMKRIHAVIHGKVIGVFFRANTANQVETIGNITGFVRNTKERTVEVVAEGEEDSLNKLLAWCQKGPLHAKVEKVDTEWEEPTGEFKKFEINY